MDDDGTRGMLEGAIVLVTGAASGIGAAVASAAADAGARAILLDRDRDAATRVASRIGRDAVAIACDVTDEASVRAAVAHMLRVTSSIDVVVTCAGVSGPVGTPLERTSLADWRTVLDVNVTGAFLVLKHALPALRASDRGAAVLLASDSAFVAASGMAAYCASKAAVVQLARALSVETAGEVRVNALCPSVVDTPMSRGDLGDPALEHAAFPVHEAATIARHVLFLAGPAAHGIHGAAIPVDFGYSVRSAFPA